MKYWKRIVCLFLSAAILFADARPAQAALTNDSIKAKEAEIDAAKKEVSGLKSNKTDLEKLKKELGELIIEGIETNVDFQYEIVNHPAFLEGKTDTGFIARHFSGI